jgi:hypothetical protein
VTASYTYSQPPPATATAHAMPQLDCTTRRASRVQHEGKKAPPLAPRSQCRPRSDQFNPACGAARCAVEARERWQGQAAFSTDQKKARARRNLTPPAHAPQGLSRSKGRHSCRSSAIGLIESTGVSAHGNHPHHTKPAQIRRPQAHGARPKSSTSKPGTATMAMRLKSSAPGRRGRTRSPNTSCPTNAERGQTHARSGPFCMYHRRRDQTAGSDAWLNICCSRKPGDVTEIGRRSNGKMELDQTSAVPSRPLMSLRPEPAIGPRQQVGPHHARPAARRCAALCMALVPCRARRCPAPMAGSQGPHTRGR